ncbi:hypothetical protein ACHQM5_026541 [Ranunculus cassubicifolius]
MSDLNKSGRVGYPALSYIIPYLNLHPISFLPYTPLIPLSPHFNTPPSTPHPYLPNMPSSSPHPKPKKLTTTNTSNPNSFLCKHSPSATRDILILILVLFSITFLLISYLTYIFQSLSQILPPFSFSQFPVFYILGILILFTVTIVTVEICFSYRLRKCEKLGCKGLKNALESIIYTNIIKEDTDRLHLLYC